LQLFENYDAFMVTGQQNATTCNREGILPMRISFSELDTPCCRQPVTIEVSPTHPLIQLAQVIPWQALADRILPDLKRTAAKGKWWLGRQLKLRIQLGAFLLQWLYNLTDRQVEWAIKDNAAYQLFCGRGLIDPWHAPDYTKIEEFRSRLSPETQRQLANVVAVWATALGFADPSAMDIDSTVQKANIRAWEQVNTLCFNLFLHVASFLCRGVVVPDEALSFHARAVNCFNTGKAAHRIECRRAFQLGRIGGNFLVVGACTSIRMEDKASIRPMIEEHQGLCGAGILTSSGMDKGYYSGANRKYLRSLVGLKKFCLQQHGFDTGTLSESAEETYSRLVDRRAGIEPLIGHAKQGGQLGQSRMKTDETTLAAGYGAIGGFNLRQLIRHLLDKDIQPMGSSGVILRQEV
jgi:hypothetical protein